MFGRHRFGYTRFSAPDLVAGNSITAAKGTYALTGTAMTVKLSLPLASAAYALTGTAAVTHIGSLISLGGGAFTVTGSDALFPQGRHLVDAFPGAYTINGSPIAVTVAGARFVKLPPPPLGVFARI